MEPEIKFDYDKWKEADSAFDHEEFDRMLDEAKEKATTLEEWAESATAAHRDVGTPPFRPRAHHNKDGDQLEVYLSDEAYFGHWLCPGIVVHCSHETGRVIGVTIEGIGRVMKQPG